MIYTTRYVHCISPKGTDTGPDAEIPDGFVFEPGRSALRQIAALLRGAKVLMKGSLVREFRREASGRIVVFPSNHTMDRIWHSVILTPKAAAGEKVQP